MSSAIVQLTSHEVPVFCEQIVGIYRAAFEIPPYSESETAVAGFAERLRRHAQQAGFRCCAARDEANGEIAGFAYGYTALPGQWWRDTVAGALRPEQVERWLSDCFELVELAIRPSLQGRGVGGRLHDAVLHGLPHRTAALSTIQADTPAMRLYRRRGWVTLLVGFDFPGTPDPYDVMGLDLKKQRE